MVDITIILGGIADALTFINFIFVILGIALGQLVGAMPGIGPVMAMAIAIPFTFTLSPIVAISFLVAVNKGALIGGAVPSILINVPGTPDAAITALDGYPMSQQGKAIRALKMAVYSSVTGDFFSTLTLITLAPLIAIAALKMGPIEIFALMVFAFSIISGLVGDSMIKGILSAVLGLMCATVGLDPQNGTPRFIFGFFQLYDGLPLVSVALGSLAVCHILHRLAAISGDIKSAVSIPKNQKKEDNSISWAEYWDCKYTLLKGSFLGVIFGAIPGLDSSAAAFMSYGSAKQASKNPESFGKGNIHGVAAAESANSAVCGANLIPMFTLGLPGNVAAALLISAFIIHGIQPGPLMFKEQGQLVYSIFATMMFANVINLIVGLLGLHLWSKVVNAPESLIYSSSLLLCIVGSYIATGGLFGVAVLLLFAVIGYLMIVFDYSPIVFIIGYFLGERIELTLGQTLTIIDGDPLVLLSHPIAILLFGSSLFSVYWFSIRPLRKKMSEGD